VRSAAFGEISIHYSGDKTTTDKSVNWYIKDDKKVTNEIKKQLKDWNAAIKQPLLKP